MRDETELNPIVTNDPTQAEGPSAEAPTPPRAPRVRTTAQRRPAALTTAPEPNEEPKRAPEEVARELFPDCTEFRANTGGDVTCKNGKGQTVLVPASKIAQYS